MYKNSPNNSVTSLSDEEDEVREELSTNYYAQDVSPAEWTSSYSHRQLAKSQQFSPASRLPPEILIYILKQLHSTRDLHNSLRVSRTWCECTVELLWHRPSIQKSDHFNQLLEVIKSHNKTFDYARFIRRLNFLALGRDLTDKQFFQLERCIKLERLTLVGCVEISDEALTKILPLFPNLVALDLTSISSTTDSSIIALAQTATRLQGINLGGCKNITDKGLLALAANCPLLRRIKLSNVKNITDVSVSAIVKSCPLLLEFDLNGCSKITDNAVRDIWTYSTHMRELRLAQCSELTDLAFPASPQRYPPQIEPTLPGAQPHPQIGPIMFLEIPPLRLTRICENLRMLDLTSCHLITDEAIEGIVSSAPRLRNLVLTKCSQLTDTAVESICKLGKNLHYLHLGHAASITDRSVRTLARSCTRLRYIDLASCPLLTDMSVFELANLQKLRRIGLVRVANLTDQAIFSLADRHSALERIHLSYCEHITILAIHFLLQRLTRLTHLSLTGNPAFRRPELQKFCRPPPREFNASQRATFCVYSGKGVNDLRNYLANVMAQDQPNDDSIDNETDSDSDGVMPSYVQHEAIMGRVSPIEIDQLSEPNTVTDSRLRTPVAVQLNPHLPLQEGMMPTSTSTTPSPAVHPSNVPLFSSVAQHQRHRFGDAPIVEQSAPSPPASPRPDMVYVYGRSVGSVGMHTNQMIEGLGVSYNVNGTANGRSNSRTSDTASERSGETNDSGPSNGATFFRTYGGVQVAAGSASSVEGTGMLAQQNGAGTHTPDLVFAELGHGRGVGVGPGMGMGACKLESSISNETVRPVFGGSSGTIASTSRDENVMWTRNERDRQMSLQLNSSSHIPFLSSSPTTRELQESVHNALSGMSSSAGPSHSHGYSALPVPNASLFNSNQVAGSSSHSSLPIQPHPHYTHPHTPDERGRSMRRSIKNTLNAAEHYASTLFFGRSGSAPSSSTSTGVRDRVQEPNGRR